MLVVAVKDAPVSTGSARESAEPLFLSLPETARDLFTSTTQPAPVRTGSARESAEPLFCGGSLRNLLFRLKSSGTFYFAATDEVETSLPSTLDAATLIPLRPLI
jgi:hypothetical protein